MIIPYWLNWKKKYKIQFPINLILKNKIKKNKEKIVGGWHWKKLKKRKEKKTEKKRSIVSINNDFVNGLTMI